MFDYGVTNQSVLIDKREGEQTKESANKEITLRWKPKAMRASQVENSIKIS